MTLASGNFLNLRKLAFKPLSLNNLPYNLMGSISVSVKPGETEFMLKAWKQSYYAPLNAQNCVDLTPLRVDHCLILIRFLPWMWSGHPLPGCPAFRITGSSVFGRVS